ncbi:MAG: flagellar hook-basal body complex protein FliE [Deltaproteobacteria bacterium]|nr:flagellar hook-basal body complex protein FliE [Deltaproteobacteria bacterium]
MENITINNNLETSFSLPINEKEPPVDGGGSFGDALSGAMGKVSELRNEADQAVHELATGENKDIHQTMIAMEKADVSFKLMMQVRNKIVTAYQEVMRMPV